MTVLTSNAINFIPLSIYKCSDLVPLHSGKWRGTCPSWVYGSGAYEYNYIHFWTVYVG